MKILRNIRFIIVLAVIAGMAFACRKQHLPAKPQPSPFNAVMEGGNTDFPAAGGKANLLVTAGEDGWWLNVPDSGWCVITNIYGAGDFSIPVTIKPNNTGVDRSIRITLNPTFNLPAVTVTLTQSK